MNLTMGHTISIIATLLFIALVGIYSGRKVKSSADFNTASKKAGWPIVTGTITGTLVGAASTIATAQLAFVYGFSAWWYTIGTGCGALILGAIFTKKLWQTNATTVPEILTREYGPAANIWCSVFVCVSLFISLIPQLIALSAMIASMLKMSLIVATFVSVLMMVLYVVFGGVWGTGFAGIAKLMLIYFSMIFCGSVAVLQSGGVSSFTSMFPPFPMFDMGGTRGLMSAMAGGLSPLVGVLASQTYIQAVMSGKNVKAGRVGALVSCCLMPPIGFVSVLVGLFMKFNHPDIISASAFPMFVLQYINPWFGGVILATLLIAFIGSGAGIALGAGTILTKDIYVKLFRPNATDKQILFVSRLMIVLLMVSTIAFTLGNLKSLMLQWTFLSMGLRGTAAFLPLIFALFFAGKVNKTAGVWSMVLGSVSLLGWKFFGNLITTAKIDSLYIGMLVAAVCMVIGIFIGREKTDLNQNVSKMR